jgi:hypothetical protein
MKTSLFGDFLKVRTRTVPAPSCIHYFRETKVKILGVFFDDKYVFDEHINCLSKKINQRIGLLSRSRHFLPEKTLVIVYNSIVLPILDY